MNNKTKGAIAGVAGIALLAGGTTFALWNGSADLNGGKITAGNLEVAVVAPAEGDSVWKDVSGDRKDNPHNIDISTFKIVPGDTIEGTFGIDAALQGENLVANLGLAAKGKATGELLAFGDKKGVTVTYSLIKADGTKVAGATDLSLGTVAPIAFTSLDNTNNQAVLPTLAAKLDGTVDYKVVVKAAFDSTVDKRDLVGKEAVLSDLGVTLDQTRTAGTGGGF